MMKNIINKLPIIIIIGFIGGGASSFYHIIINRYLNYEMYKLVCLSFQKYINKWLILILTIFIVGNLLNILFEFISNRFRDKNHYKFVKIAWVFTICVLFFIFVGWVINHYFLPNKFHFISLFFDALLLFFTIFLGWILIKMKLKSLFNFVETRYLKKAAIPLFVIIGILNILIFIDKKMNIPKGPNIILVSVDALRADHLGCYGYKEDTSPNVDKFAEENVLFENGFSQAPVTGSSCASILSGFLPHETSVYDNYLLPRQINTIAEFLKNKGYKTAAIVSNYVLRKNRGYWQGFDIYDDEMKDEELTRHLPERIAEKTTSCAIRYLKKYSGHTFFMWIHYQDPHGPYTPQSPFNNFFVDNKEKQFDLKFNETISGKGGIPSYQKLGKNKSYYYYVAQYDGEIR